MTFQQLTSMLIATIRQTNIFVMDSPNSPPSPVDCVTTAVDCVTSGEGCSSRDQHLDVVCSTINSDHQQPPVLQGLQKDNVSSPSALRYSMPQVPYHVSRFATKATFSFRVVNWCMLLSYLLACRLIRLSYSLLGSEPSFTPEFVSTIGPVRFWIGAVSRHSLSWPVTRT